MRKGEYTKVLSLLLIFTTLSACERNVDLDVGSGDYDEEGSEVVDNIGNVETHFDAADYTWNDSSVVYIEFNGTSITTNGKGVDINGSTARILTSGTYSISGTLNDGQLIVDSESDSIVRLIFNGVAMKSSSSAPLYVVNSYRTMIVLADDTENTVSDNSPYVSSDDGPNAAIYSADDLTIFGEGSLIVNGNYNDGITSKDGLIISSGNINVTAVDDGIRGKDYLFIQDGDIEIVSGGDGIKSDNDANSSMGYIEIVDGTISINCGGDAIVAETDVIINYAELNITAGGGSGVSNSAISAKGIKSGALISITDGDFIIDAADDAIHSDGDILINNGNYNIASADDGIHSELNTEINSGNISITKSYEGIESALGNITINGGLIYIVASDDGINISAGGAMDGGPQGPGRKSTDASGEYGLYITGGYLFVDCEGDGLDSNDLIEISGGCSIVNSAEYNENSAIDYDGVCNIYGGTVIGVGTSVMSEGPSQSSSQYSLFFDLQSKLGAGTLIHVEDTDGNSILTYRIIKSIQSIVFSSPELTNGSSYKMYVGGAASGTETDGLFTDEIYSGGTLLTSFTISSIITTKNL